MVARSTDGHKTNASLGAEHLERVGMVMPFFELYPLNELVQTGDDNELEPDNDKISDIANSWLFMD